MEKTGLLESGRLWIPSSLKIPTFWRYWTFTKYNRTPLIRIDWESEPSGYEENPDNWIFL
jgi:hypothetical protein